MVVDGELSPPPTPFLSQTATKKMHPSTSQGLIMHCKCKTINTLRNTKFFTQRQAAVLVRHARILARGKYRICNSIIGRPTTMGIANRYNIILRSVKKSGRSHGMCASIEKRFEAINFVCCVMLVDIEAGPLEAARD